MKHIRHFRQPKLHQYVDAGLKSTAILFFVFTIMLLGTACDDAQNEHGTSAQESSLTSGQLVAADRSSLPQVEKGIGRQIEASLRAEDKCCSDPGSIATCWWQDAERDGVVCDDNDDCVGENACNKALEIDGVSPPNDWGVCECTKNTDCKGDIVDGVQLYGVCTEGVCGPSYCNGYSICSCLGGCMDGPAAGYDNPYEMCIDTDEGYPGGCCEGVYPTDPSGTTAGFCSTQCAYECTTDDDCNGDAPAPYSSDCTRYVCVTGSCQILYQNAGEFCEANVINASGFDGTASRNSDGTVPAVTDSESCYETKCDTLGQCIALAVEDNLSCADDGSQCTEEYCSAGSCIHNPINVDGPCNLDGDGCTIERCSPSGECDAEGSKDCTVLDDDSENPIDDSNINHCRADVCVDPDGANASELGPDEHLNTGVCTTVALDGVDATTNGFADTSDCKNMVCVAGTEDVEDVVCTNPYDSRCNDYICEEGQGCHVNHLPYTLGGTSCDDGDPCTEDDMCVEDVDGDVDIGVCRGTAIVCSDTDCTAGSCVDGVCVNTPANEDEACTDDDPCSTASICDSGSCVATTFMDCSNLDDGECIIGECDSGSCVSRERDNGSNCDDGNACTVGDTCAGGVCDGTDIDCSGEGDQCNVIACNPSNGRCEVFDNDTMVNALCAADTEDCTIDRCVDSDGLDVGSSELSCVMASAECCSTNEDCNDDLDLDCVNDDGSFSECYSPVCTDGLCECGIADEGTTCTDNDIDYPPQCYESACDADAICRSAMLEIAEVPNNLCSDLFVDGSPSTIDTSSAGYLGSFSSGAALNATLTAAGSTLCSQNNYAAAKENECEEALTQEDLGYMGEDVAYVFRYESQDTTEIDRHAYLITVEADFDAAVYIQDGITNAAECPEGNSPSADTGCDVVADSEILKGSISFERWDNVYAHDVDDIPVDSSPDLEGTLSSLEIPSNVANNYGMRIRGYLTPETDGDHYFWIASDNEAELYLSTTESPDDKVRVAYNSSSTPSRDWDYLKSRRGDPQASGAVSLSAGSQYYIEVLFREGGYSRRTGYADHMAVGWSEPGGSTSTADEVIPGSVLSPYSGDVSTPVVETLGSWQNVSGATSLSWGAVPSGDNRLLVVAVEMEYTSGAGSCEIEDVTFGGNSGALASDGTVSGQLDSYDKLLSEIWLINEAAIASRAGDTIVVDVSNSCTYSGITIHAGMYAGVDQSTPVLEVKTDYDTPHFSRVFEIDDTDPGVVFYGTYWGGDSWGIGTGCCTYMGLDRYTPNSSASAGHYFTYTFRGSEVEYWGVRDYHHGTASIYIDDVLMESSVDGYAASRTSSTLKLWPPDPLRLDDEEHTLKVVINGDGTVVGDLIKYYSTHADNPLSGDASSLTADEAGNAVLSFISCDYDESATWHADLDKQSDKADTTSGLTAGSVADTVVDGAGAVTCQATWSLGPFVTNQISIELNSAPVEDPTASCGYQVPWECTVPYADGASTPAVMEESCNDGNTALDQACCDACDESCQSSGYKWCTRGYNSNDSECDYCDGECDSTWTAPFDPIVCTSNLPSSEYSGYTKRSMTILTPDYTTDGSWRSAIIYVDGSNDEQGDFYLTVEKIPWVSSPCDRANDDVRVTDITHVPAGGFSIPGTLEGLVNSDHDTGTGADCGGYDCTAGWSGVAQRASEGTYCHENGAGISANAFWPAKAYYTIYRTESDGAMDYCITTRRPTGDVLDAVLTLEEVTGVQQDICYENFTYVDCERNNYDAANARLDFIAQINTQYKIGVSRYGHLLSPCDNDRLDGCDYILDVQTGSCP